MLAPRILKSFAACALALAAVGAHAQAAWKPTKPVDLIVHTGPGGGSDLLARAIVSMLEKEKLLPVRMQVQNRTEVVARLGHGMSNGRDMTA